LDRAEIRATLEGIATLLESGQQWPFAVLVRDALAGPYDVLEQFLISNSLWGGSGSIADLGFDGRSAERKELERLLIDLGDLQIRASQTNPRTQSWVKVFKSWRQSGI